MAKKKVKRSVVKAIANIKATFNNTYITIADVNGETLCWSSAGTVGFKGSRKSTPLCGTESCKRRCGKSTKIWR